MAYQAVVTWKAGRHFEGISNGHAIQMDSPLPTGSDQGMSPMSMLLVALGGCTGIDVVDILSKERQEITNLTVDINAERAKEYPMVFTKVELIFKVFGHGLRREAVERAVRLSKEKYCSVGIMLAKTAHISTIIEIEEG
jgi:putative redox protein